ncbi:MAG: DNA oxidative demethylase AlkB [Pseudomonadota bacterium]
MSHQLHLFDEMPQGTTSCWIEKIAPETTLLHHFASAHATQLLAAVEPIIQHAPFRHMTTPGGFCMSVAMTSCGEVGWISDIKGYRYSPVDPQTGQPWLPIPPLLAQLAHEAAAESGFLNFTPDTCLINRYEPDNKLSLHQDKDEGDFDAPIVSVSLGVPAVFLWGGNQRTDTITRIPLLHGDVIVWGGVDRLRFHGIMPIKTSYHALTGTCRINLTFRKAF